MAEQVYNNCSELINAVTTMVGRGYVPMTIIEVQGDECEMWYESPNLQWLDNVVIVTKDNHIFIVGEGISQLWMYVYSKSCRLEDTLRVTLPMNMRDELIAALEGEV